MPYAPVSTVVDTLRRFRNNGVRDTITPAELKRFGVADGMATRVAKCLDFLGLIDNDFRATTALSELIKAGSDDYPLVMAGILQKAYRPIFDIVNPETATDTQFADAFRGFEPQAQRERMVALYLGLCREAGLVSLDRVPAPRSQATQKRPVIKSGVSTASNGMKNTGTNSKVEDDQHQHRDQQNGKKFNEYAPEYELLASLLVQLPKNGIWTKQRRDRWLGAVTANLDLLVEIEEENLKKPEVQTKLFEDAEPQP